MYVENKNDFDID